MKRGQVPFHNLDESVTRRVVVRHTIEAITCRLGRANWIVLLDKFIRMSEKVGQHFEKRPALEDKRRQGDFSQIHRYASLKEASPVDLRSVLSVTVTCAIRCEMIVPSMGITRARDAARGARCRRTKLTILFGLLFVGSFVHFHGNE